MNWHVKPEKNENYKCFNRIGSLFDRKVGPNSILEFFRRVCAFVRLLISISLGFLGVLNYSTFENFWLIKARGFKIKILVGKFLCHSVKNFVGGFSCNFAKLGLRRERHEAFQTSSSWTSFNVCENRIDSHETKRNQSISLIVL